MSIKRISKKLMTNVVTRTHFLDCFASFFTMYAIKNAKLAAIKNQMKNSAVKSPTNIGRS
jgi:hypothetical protein